MVRVSWHMGTRRRPEAAKDPKAKKNTEFCKPPEAAGVRGVLKVEGFLSGAGGTGGQGGKQPPHSRFGIWEC